MSLDIRTIYLKPRLFLMTMLIALALINQNALAKKVDNDDAATALTKCILADDADDKILKKDGSYACCSKSEKFCIWCPVNTDKKCVVKPTKITTPGGTPPFITTINPAYFNDLTGDASPNNATLSPIKNFLLRKKAGSVGNNYDNKHRKQFGDDQFGQECFYRCRVAPGPQGHGYSHQYCEEKCQISMPSVSRNADFFFHQLMSATDSFLDNVNNVACFGSVMWCRNGYYGRWYKCGSCVFSK